MNSLEGPAPTRYNFKSDFSLKDYKAGTYSFGKASRVVKQSYEPSIVPGPETYEIQDPVSGAPKFSVRKRLSGILIKHNRSF